MTERERLDEITRLGACGTAIGAAELTWLFDSLGLPVKRLQRRAAEALAALDSAGVVIRPSLEARLEGGSFSGRWGAAYALARAGDPPEAVLPVLLEAMAATDGDLRWAAARIAVDQVRSPALPSALLAAAADDRPELRKMAVYCLRDLAMRSPECEARFRTALRDEAAGVRLAGMSALARLGIDPATTAAALLPLLHDAEPGVQRAAAATIGRLGCRTPEVAAALERAAGAEDGFLARAAARALEILRAGER